MSGEKVVFALMVCALAASLPGCPSLRPLEPDAACLDAGYAIARRTFECTDDPELSNARFELFRQEYTCLDLPEAPEPQTVAFTQLDTGQPAVVAPEDVFHCSFAISLLPCELVEAYGDDLDAWLATSDACTWVVAPKEGA